MSTETSPVVIELAEKQLRRFLLYVAGFVWAGSIIELLLAEHTDGWVQYIPFAVSALGVVAVAVALRRASATSFRFLRAVCALAIIASLVGGYKHFAANYELEAEVNATATMGVWIWDALFGASPLLAPGVLALAAVLAWAATWRVRHES